MARVRYLESAKAQESVTKKNVLTFSYQKNRLLISEMNYPVTFSHHRHGGLGFGNGRGQVLGALTNVALGLALGGGRYGYGGFGNGYGYGYGNGFYGK